MKERKDTVGMKFTGKVPTVSPEDTLSQIEKKIRNAMGEMETINYLYVIDKKQKLLGLFSIKDLFRFPPDTTVKKIYQRKDLITIKPGTHQERAAYLALKHNIKAVPVVDEENTFL